MRKDLKKMLFIGLSREQKDFFREAQESGIIHFIKSSNKNTVEWPEELQKLGNALKILRSLPVLDQANIEDFSLAEGIVHKILSLQRALEDCEEKKRLLKQEMEKVRPLGEFSQKDLEYIENEAKRTIQFFWAKQGIFSLEMLPAEVVHIGSEGVLDYYISISKDHLSIPHLVEIKAETPIQALRLRSIALEKERADLETELKTYQKYSTFLHHDLIYLLNRHHLHSAQSNVQVEVEGELFAIEGWVPEDQLEFLKELNQRHQVHSEEVAIQEGEQIPTYLENQGAAKIGEDLVNVYDAPSSTDVDPSLWVLVFFSFFFAIIIGDAGYGLIFAAIALYMRWKNKKMTKLGYRLWALTSILAGSCIVWGVMINSYFGMTPSPESPWMKVSLINMLVKKKTEYHWAQKDSVYQEWVKEFPAVENLQSPQEIIMVASSRDALGEPTYDLYNAFSDHILMELALFIGVVHILISLIRYSNRNKSHFGWMLFIIGCYLYLPHYLGVASMTQYLLGFDTIQLAKPGLYLLTGGCLIAVALSIMVHKWKGAFEIMTVIQVFSDVLSYLRLYALGMGGAMMSSTVNEGAAALGGILGILIICLGHVFNLVLSIMGGVMHGLRLNFLEWYHYSFEGGGRLFSPLKKIQIE